MEASFLPKVEVQGRKKKEHGHSLLFDNSMTDKVMRLNAYEERLLVKRTEHIEKEKQQTLEEHNFSKSQFLLRFQPVMQRQNELRKEFLAKVFDSEDSPGVKTTVPQNRPLSSYPKVRSRAGTAKGGVKPSLRRTVSAELRFPALQESMDDLLNGYRTRDPQPKSVSPSKLRFRGNWDLDSHTNDTRPRNGTSLPKNVTPERKTASKCVGFQDENVEKRDSLTSSSTLDYREMSKGKVKGNFTTFSVKHLPNREVFEADKGDRTIIQQKLIDSKFPEQKCTEKNPNGYRTKPEDMLNVGDNYFWKKSKFFQNNHTLHEDLLKEVIHTLKSDSAASNTTRFLAKMLNGEGHGNLPCVEENSGNVVSFQLGNSVNGVHLLSDVKKRQRHEAQRLRIMRTIVLAYDTVWNERVKKISTAA